VTSHCGFVVSYAGAARQYLPSGPGGIFCVIVHFATLECGWHALLWYPSAVQHGLMVGECVVEVELIAGLDQTIAL
jgi:hypothetical protein